MYAHTVRELTQQRRSQRVTWLRVKKCDHVVSQQRLQYLAARMTRRREEEEEEEEDDSEKDEVVAAAVDDNELVSP